jgi:hypothetical protein
MFPLFFEMYENVTLGFIGDIPSKRTVMLKGDNSKMAKSY